MAGTVVSDIEQQQFKSMSGELVVKKLLFIVQLSLLRTEVQSHTEGSADQNKDIYKTVR